MTRRTPWLALGWIFALVWIVAPGCDRAARTPAETDEPAPEPAASAARASAEARAGHERMVARLQDLARASRESGAVVGEAVIRRLRAQVAGLNSSTSARDRLIAYVRLGREELEHGNERAAIDWFLQAKELAPQVPDLPRSSAFQLAFQLAVAYFRLGETSNCCRRNTPDSCILPIQGEGVHTDAEGSSLAIRQLEQILQVAPDGSPLALRSRWLLNLAYMTLGGYPQKVPRELLIPPEAFASEAPFPRFKNVAAEVGVDTFSLAGGAIVDDFDGDGLLDVVVSAWDPSAPLRYYRNDGEGKFVERTEEAGLTDITGGLNTLQADYDGDGAVDILVLRGAWLSARHPNSLLRNLGDGAFVDVTYVAGLAGEDWPSQTAAWADYDNDGDLDLYVGNEAAPELAAPSQLFRNNGDGTFSDVAREARVTNDRFTKAVVWGDYDADRWPDLFVSNYGQPNRLYHNNGDGTFTDVAVETGVAEPIRSFPAWFWDYDNDGNLDLFVSGYSARIEDVAADRLGLPHRATLARLFRGDGRGGFRDIASTAGLSRPTAPMGANHGDLDGDGYLDFYLGTGWPEYHELMPNAMMLNRAGERFADVTTAGGFGHLQKGHGVVFADIDNDGDQDVFQEMGGWFPGDRYFDVLYRNPGFGTRWLSVKLIGVDSNRSAIGARIRVDVLTKDGERRSIYRHVDSGGSFGANPLRQTIGLGVATAVEQLVVYWPTSDRTQTFRDVPLDRHIIVKETDEQLRVRELPRFELGGT